MNLFFLKKKLLLKLSEKEKLLEIEMLLMCCPVSDSNPDALGTEKKDQAL